MDHVSICFQNARLQPFPDQGKKGPVIDPYAQHVQQPRMVQMVKEAFDVDFSHIPIPSILQIEGQVSDRIQRPPSWAIAVTAIQKVLRIDGSSQLRTGQLHQCIFECRDA